MSSKIIEEEGGETVGTIEEFAAEGEDENEIEQELESSYESVVCERKPVDRPSSELDPKALLRQFKHKGKSLYEHLIRIMEYIISTRPGNTIDYFDQFSRAFREPKTPANVADYLEKAIKQTRIYSILSSGMKIGNMPDEGEPEEEDFEDQPKKSVINFLDSADYFQEMDIGLPKNVIYQIDASIRHLALREGIQKARFWGMIFGIKRSYLIAECELTHSEIEMRLREEKARMYEGEEEQEAEEEQTIQTQPSFFGFSSFFINDAEEIETPYKKLARYKLPPLPIPVRKEKPKMKKEDIGEGANKKVYFVCHEPGDEWRELPNVQPEHILVARQIRKYFQGNLSADVDCYPPFPGKEREYLRAQIARISAGTQISPIGYYQFGSLDEMGEEGTETDIVINLEYEVIPYQDLLSTSFWVHHVPHILKIGRTTYYEPPKRFEEEIEEEEAGEKEASAPKELGPPLLTPLSEDVNMYGVSPWTIKGTSKLIPGSGAVSVTSNLWPGAYCVSRGRYFENVYLGFGLKFTEGYSPLLPPFPEKEYEVGPEISEIDDPKPEEEEEWRKAHEMPPITPFMAEGEGEEETGPLYPEPDSDV